MVSRSTGNRQFYFVVIFVTLLIVDLVRPQWLGKISTTVRAQGREQQAHLRGQERCDEKSWWRRAFCDPYKEDLVYNKVGIEVLASIEKHAAHVINDSMLLLEKNRVERSVCENMDEDDEGDVGVYVKIGDSGNGGKGVVGGDILGGRFGSGGTWTGEIGRKVVVKGVDIKGRKVMMLNGMVFDKKQDTRLMDGGNLFGIMPFELLYLNLNDDVKVAVGFKVRCACVYEDENEVVCDRNGAGVESDPILSSDIKHIRISLAEMTKVSEDTASSLFRLVVVPNALK